MRQQWSIQRSAAVLRVPGPQDDKYTRGVLGFRTGSESYPGAAVLGVQAAWRTGVGMVRYLGPERAGALVLAAHPETVLASGRVQAWVIGSGTDPEHRLAEEESQLREVLGGTESVVVDAGALDLAAEGRAPVILTPHDREHERLRVQLGIGEPEPTRVETAAHTARVLGAVVVLKGARTIIAAPDGGVRLVDAATSWLATAGTGDVLAGAIGAVVAGGAGRDVALQDAAATGVWLHARAAARAAARWGARGGPITASDVADQLRAVVGEVVSTRANPSS